MTRLYRVWEDTGVEGKTMSKAERAKPTGEIHPGPAKKKGHGLRLAMAGILGAASIAGAAIGISKALDRGGESSPDKPAITETLSQTFDPNADKGIIVPGVNAKIMTLSEYEALKIPFSEKERVTTGLFVKFPEGITPTLTYNKPSGGFGRGIGIKQTDPNNPLKYTVESNEKVKSSFDVSWTTTGSAVNPQEHPIIFAPFDGMINFTHSQIYENTDGTLKYSTLYLTSTDINGNDATLMVYAEGIKPLLPSSRFIVEGNTSSPAPSYEIKKGTPIFEFLENDNKAGLHITAFSHRVDDGIRTGGPQNLSLGTTTGDSGNTVAILLKPDNA